MVIASPGPSYGESWPCYKADAHRASVSQEALDFPLSVSWQYRPAQPPRPAWPQPGWELHRIDFDYTFQPVVEDGLLFFSSSSDDSVRALDATNGKHRWRFTTGGPVRFAPHISESRCYFASDDGYVYCLEAASGKLIWRFQAAPENRMLVGNDQLISRWPCRSGVLVLDGIVYATAGVWPSEGVFVYALDAKTGKQIWVNDTSGTKYLHTPYYNSYSMGGVAPQGYLLAAEGVLLVPTGRGVPAGFSLDNGKLLHYRIGTGNQMNGGCWATYGGRMFFNPVHRRGGKPRPWGEEAPPGQFDGMRAAIIVTGHGGRMTRGRHRVLTHKPRIYLAGNGVVDARDYSRHGRGSLFYRAHKTFWQTEGPHPYSIAKAGEDLLIGGQDIIRAYRAEDGSSVWQGKLKGQVRGMAIAGRRLYASTETGTIYCFDSGERQAAVIDDSQREQPASSPLPAMQTCIERVQSLSLTNGFALVTGQDDTRLAEMIAAMTRLKVVALLPSEQIASERKRLIDESQLYGHKIRVLSAEHLPDLPDYFANVAVAGPGTTIPSADSDLFRILRPSGGAVIPFEMDINRLMGALASNRPAQVGRLENGMFIRSRLVGAFDWNSEASADERVKWPLELLWFGGPGPARVGNRPPVPVAPIAANGRIFILGMHHVTAIDAYNGLELWNTVIGMTNFQNPKKNYNQWKVTPIAADDSDLYVNFPGTCLVLDGTNGKPRKTFGPQRARQVFTLDEPQTFELKQQDDLVGKAIVSIVDEDVVIQLETNDQKRTPIDSWELFFDFRKPSERSPVYTAGAFHGTVVIDEDSSKTRWRPGIGPVFPDVTLSTDIKKDGSSVTLRLSLDEPDPDFLFAATLISDDGKTDTPVRRHLFTDAGHSFTGDGWARFKSSKSELAEATLANNPIEEMPDYARGWGRQPKAQRDQEMRQRSHPLTYDTVTKTYKKDKGCGGIISSGSIDFFRSSTLGFYDLEDDSGMRNFFGVRVSCGRGTSVVPAHGLVVSTEGSAQCGCSYNFKTSFALAPARKRRHEDWAVFHDLPRAGTVKRLALNLGAPGDRRDEDGTLWLGIPRPQSQLKDGTSASHKPWLKRNDLKPPFEFILHKGFGPYRRNAERLKIQGTERPWIYASGIRGIQKTVIDLKLISDEFTSLPAETAPTIDGALNEDCWKSGYEKSEWLGRTEKTKTWIRHDSRNLYIAHHRIPYLDRRGRPAKWLAATSGEDAPVWEDTSFFVQISDSDRRACLNLGVAASGARYDSIWPYPDLAFPPVDIPFINVVDSEGAQWSWRTATSLPQKWAAEGFQMKSLVAPGGRMLPADDFDPSVSLGWNSEGLLLSFEIRDDEVKLNPNLWKGDHIWVSMSSERSIHPYYEVYIPPPATDKVSPLRFRFGDRRPRDMVSQGKLRGRFLGRRTETGYEAIAFLPWKNLMLEPGKGDEIVVQLKISDVDPQDPSPMFKAYFHPNGVFRPTDRMLSFEMPALRLRLAEKASRTMVFTRNESPDAKGLFTARTPSPLPIGLKPKEAVDYDTEWKHGVTFSEETFTAEMAIPLESIAAAGIKTDSLFVGFRAGKLIARPNEAHGYKPLRRHSPAGQIMRPYTVRMHFAELDDVKPGTRVFDIRLQGKTVETGFDVTREGSSLKAIRREFKGIRCGKDLKIEFVSKSVGMSDQSAPILSGLEVMAE